MLPKTKRFNVRMAILLLINYNPGLEQTNIVSTQECCEQYWTSPGSSIPQNSHCTTTYLPSRKLSKLNEQDMQDTAGEVGMGS